MRRYFPAFALLAGATVFVVSSIASGDYVVNGVIAVLMIVGGLLVSPLPFPSGGTKDWRNAERAGDVVVLHRPGCTYCLRMRFVLGDLAKRATWADIWADETAAARVREATGGDETVPTVLVDGEAHVNPDPAWVRRRLAS